MAEPMPPVTVGGTHDHPHTHADIHDAVDRRCAETERRVEDRLDAFRAELVARRDVDDAAGAAEAAAQAAAAASLAAAGAAGDAADAVAAVDEIDADEDDEEDIDEEDGDGAMEPPPAPVTAKPAGAPKKTSMWDRYK